MSSKSEPMKPGVADTFFRRFRHRLAASTLRAPLLIWRHRGITEDDVILGCYPRSGGTWLRFVLFEILTGKPSSFDQVNRAFRGLSDHRHGWRLLPRGGRFIGSHEPYSAAYRKAVYLVRDIRDVALSEFALETSMRMRRGGFEEYLEDMLQGGGKYGSWQDHVRSWLDSPLANTSNFLLIRYEDLRRESLETFAKLASFLGVGAERGVIEQALMNNSIEKMREKEDHLYTQKNYQSVPRRPEKGTEADGRFVRAGKMGGWQEKLTPKQLALIERHTADILRRLDYPVVSLEDASTLG